MSTFTLSRDDFLDYIACPKIVSIKAYRELHAPPRPRVEYDTGAPIRAIIGKAGEAAFELAFAGGKETALTARQIEAERKRIEREIMARIAGFDKWIDAAVRRVVLETSRGIVGVRRSIVEEYGPIEVLGRGDTRNGLAPSYAKFDFIATRAGGRPIIIEVKNTLGRLTGAARFQATFYNSLAREYGVVVRGTTVTSKQVAISPTEFRDTSAETIVVNPRAGSYEVVKDTTDVTPRRVKSVWEAKQLGFRGRFVETNCGEGCRHHAYEAKVAHKFTEDRAAPAPPLPLAFVRGLIEDGADLRAQFYRRLLHREPYRAILREYLQVRFYARDKPAKLEELLSTTARKLGTEPDILTLALKEERHRPKKAEKSIQSELSQWSKLVGKKKMRSARLGGLAAAYKVYPTPNDPARFVRDCEHGWR